MMKKIRIISCNNIGVITRYRQRKKFLLDRILTPIEVFEDNLIKNINSFKKKK